MAARYHEVSLTTAQKNQLVSLAERVRVASNQSDIKTQVAEYLIRLYQNYNVHPPTDHLDAWLNCAEALQRQAKSDLSDFSPIVRAFYDDYCERLTQKIAQVSSPAEKLPYQKTLVQKLRSLEILFEQNNHQNGTQIDEEAITRKIKNFKTFIPATVVSERTAFEAVSFRAAHERLLLRLLEKHETPQQTKKRRRRRTTYGTAMTPITSKKIGFLDVARATVGRIRNRRGSTTNIPTLPTTPKPTLTHEPYLKCLQQVYQAHEPLSAAVVRAVYEKAGLPYEHALAKDCQFLCKTSHALQHQTSTADAALPTITEDSQDPNAGNQAHRTSQIAMINGLLPSVDDAVNRLSAEQFHQFKSNFGEQTEKMTSLLLQKSYLLALEQALKSAVTAVYQNDTGEALASGSRKRRGSCMEASNTDMVSYLEVKAELAKTKEALTALQTTLPQRLVSAIENTSELLLYQGNVGELGHHLKTHLLKLTDSIAKLTTQVAAPEPHSTRQQLVFTQERLDIVCEAIDRLPEETLKTVFKPVIEDLTKLFAAQTNIKLALAHLPSDNKTEQAPRRQRRWTNDAANPPKSIRQKRLSYAEASDKYIQKNMVIAARINLFPQTLVKLAQEQAQPREAAYLHELEETSHTETDGSVLDSSTNSELSGDEAGLYSSDNDGEDRMAALVTAQQRAWMSNSKHEEDMPTSGVELAIN